MLYLRFGDRLPSVGVVQRLINECRQTDRRCAGIAELVEDGIFGPRTFAAVKALQRALSVQPDNGVFDPSTWRALAGLRKGKIVDVTDLAIESLYQSEGELALRQRLIGQYQRRFPERTLQRAEFAVDRSIRRYQAEIRACRSQHERFVASGGDPIGLTDVKNTFDTIRRGIEARSRDGSRVVLLRFTGHGSPAAQGVAGSPSKRPRSCRTCSISTTTIPPSSCSRPSCSAA